MAKRRNSDLPSEFAEQFEKENLNTVEMPQAPPEIEFPEGTEPGEEPVYEGPQDLEDKATEMLDDLENTIEIMDEGDAAELAEWLLDIVETAKDGISLFFSRELERELKSSFTQADAELLALIQFLDQENRLNFETLKEMSEKYGYSFARLMELKVQFTKIKIRWETKEIRDRQKEGIRRNAQKTIQKYFSMNGVDPAIMLAGYVGVALGGDVLRIWSNKFVKP